MLVESGKKKMLLTGDTLDLDFIDDLGTLGLLNSKDQLPVDLLKLPHHGSEFNCHEELFETVKAKHYVIRPRTASSTIPTCHPRAVREVGGKAGVHAVDHERSG